MKKFSPRLFWFRFRHRGMTYRDVVLNDGTVAYWPLNEMSGDTAHDRSGHDNHGTYRGGKDK